MVKRKSKGTTIPTGRVTKNWTTRQLRQYIRVQTALAEERIKNLTVGDTKIAGVDKEIAKLQRAAGVKPRKGHSLGLGLSYKKKDALLKQARALQRFGNVAISKLENKDRVMKAYESFKRRHGEISFEEWQRQVEAVNTYGNELFDQPFADKFRVDTNIIRLWEELESRTGVKINLGDAMHNAYNEYMRRAKEFEEKTGKHFKYDKREYIDLVYEYMKEQVREANGDFNFV